MRRDLTSARHLRPAIVRVSVYLVELQIGTIRLLKSRSHRVKPIMVSLHSFCNSIGHAPHVAQPVRVDGTTAATLVGSSIVSSFHKNSRASPSFLLNSRKSTN